MNRRSRRPVIINLIKTQIGYAFDSLPRRDRQVVQFDLQSHLSDSSSMQDPFHINFNSVPKISSTSIHTTIPVTSSWFDLDEINQIERQALPEFFGLKQVQSQAKKEMQQQGKTKHDTKKRYKTPNDYLTIRNAIVSLWRDNNKRYLTATYCRKKINFDHCSITRIHGFLQQWGIINFPSKQYKGFLKKVDVSVECMVCSNRSLRLHFTDEAGELFQICELCFQDKIYPKVLDSQKFKFVDLSQQHLQATEKPFSDQQNKLLLQAIQRHRHNWPTVAAQFPNRSIQSLIVHFLKLPFLNVSNFSIFQQGQDTKIPIQNFTPLTIFQDYNNPLQSAAALMYYKYKNGEGDVEMYGEVLDAAEEHAKYLRWKQEGKIKELLRFVIDFQMNKMEGKLVCLNQFKGNVEIESRSVQGLRRNVLGTVLHGLGKELHELSKEYNE